LGNPPLISVEWIRSNLSSKWIEVLLRIEKGMKFCYIKDLFEIFAAEEKKDFSFREEKVHRKAICLKTCGKLKRNKWMESFVVEFFELSQLSDDIPRLHVSTSNNYGFSINYEKSKLAWLMELICAIFNDVVSISLIPDNTEVCCEPSKILRHNLLRQKNLICRLIGLLAYCIVSNSLIYLYVFE
jgi:hypothetical protein